MKAGGNISTYATQFGARGNLKIEAGGKINYYAVQDQLNNSTTSSSKSSLWGIKYSSSKDSSTRSTLSGQVTKLQSQQDILSASGGDQLLQGTTVIYGGTATFAAGVGEKAKADARIILEGVKNRVSESKQKQSNYVVWQKMEDSGQVVETLTVPGFQGPTAPKFSAPGGLTVQLPASSDFKTQVQKLSSQAGQGYMTDLAARKDVNWQPVKLAYDKWDYKQEGLTPAGAALVAVAVAWATGGTGAALTGTSGTTGLMANAAFTSLASQATISLINNKGDIGKTLKELGSSQVAKATIAAALTAGVIHKLGATSTMRDLAGKTGFSEKLTYNLINATGRALTNTAINGGNLEEALKQALIGGLVDTAHGEVASHIKGLESQYLAHKLAHALAGCVAGAAAQGTCRDGAIGAAVGEVVAQMFEGQKPGAYATGEEVDAYNNKVLGYSKLVAGAVSAYAGGNAQTAITTAETAVRNNFLTFDENQLRKQASAACKTGDAKACADEKRWNQLDGNRDEKVRQVCASNPASQECTDWRNFALFARSSYSGQVSGRGAVLDMLQNGQYSDIAELQSIQRLLSSTPYAYNVSANPHLHTLVSIVADLTPIVGDVKAFYEAKDPFDYTLAVVGALGPAGDAAASLIKSAKAAYRAGEVAKAESLLQDAKQVTKNHFNGWVFEDSGLKALGLDKNTRPITSIAANGASIAIIPDGVIGGLKGTFVEFKNVINITNSSQFKGYAAAKQPIYLVVSPRTQTISDEVWRMVTSNGKVIRYDPATGIKTELLKRPGA